MNKNIFISFKDSRNDPTFSDAVGAEFVVANNDWEDEDDNPCVGKRLRIPCLPKKTKDISAFATIMGWAVEQDNEGNMVIYPGCKY